VHPEVRRFVETFHAKMDRNGRITRLNENEIRFLEQIFAPEFSYNFQGLTAQLPFKDYKGTNRYIDFYYECGEIRILIEVDSYQYHVEDLSPQEYDDHQERQNDLILSNGWILVRFTAGMILKKAMVCRRQLVQAVGKSLILAHPHSLNTEDQLWQRRRSEILNLAGHHPMIKPSHVTQRFGVTPKTASKWLRRMAEDGNITPFRSNRLITGYTLPASENAKIAVKG
jgi:very-short-patch-repair endonuclease